jgi:catechol 2,3-dioxygenase-like lactoylglutathione lyase family enzyme
MITHLRVLSVPVKDQEKAKKFYTEVLGFECTTDSSWGEGMRWIEVAPKGSQTAFSLVTWFPNMQPGGIAGMVLVSDKLEQDHTLLREKGVKIADIEATPWGHFAHFEDPDGNAWELYQA